jgi:predicted TIM-barrel fold metal-dependent hydrolase
MWSLIDKDMVHRRPILVSVPEDTLYGDNNAFWLIDGQIVPKPKGKAGNLLITPSASKRQALRDDISIASRELTDTQPRLEDMDRLSVEVQVVYPTLFLAHLTDDLPLEVALSRAYNRWLAQAWAKGNSRLLWVAVLPLSSAEESVKEMRFAKEHGAVGLFFRGLERDLNLDDPHFFPIYEEARKLDLSICIHTGAGAPTISNLFDLERHSVFAQGRLLPVIAFRNLVANKIPERFPGLRFGFIEAAASWVPYVLHALKRQSRTGRYSNPVDLFHDYRIYVACEADEDISYLAQYLGEDHMIIGSDYGHRDPSEEREFVGTMKSREDVPPALIEKILCENPRRFYGL